MPRLEDSSKWWVDFKQYDKVLDSFGYTSKEEKFLSEGDEFKIIYNDKVILREVKRINNNMVYWEDDNEEFSFAPLESFSKIKGKFILVL